MTQPPFQYIELSYDQYVNRVLHELGNIFVEVCNNHCESEIVAIKSVCYFRLFQNNRVGKISIQKTKHDCWYSEQKYRMFTQVASSHARLCRC